MSVNILELLNTAVGGQLLTKIAALVGEDEQKTAIAFRNAVPAILGGLIKKSATLDGAELVLRSLSGFNGGVLQNFENIISGGELENFSKIGTGVSQAIFGSEYDTAIGAVSEYSGVNPLASATLLGLATPVVLGVLGHEKETNNLNRDGLASFLNGQKLHVIQATPHELVRSLGLSEFFVAKSDTAPIEPSRPVSAPVEETGTAVVETSKAAETTKKTRRTKSGGLLKVLVPLLLIAAIGYGGWQFMQGGNSAELTQQDSIPATIPTSVETVTEKVADAEQVTGSTEKVEQQATQPAANSIDTEAIVENRVDDTISTHGEEQVDTLANTDVQTDAESLAIEAEPQDSLANVGVPALVGTEEIPGDEPASASLTSLDPSSSDSADTVLSEVASSPESAAAKVVADPIVASLPEPANVNLTDELGSEPLDNEPAPAAEPQETNLDTRNVVNDVTPESLQLIEPAAPAITGPSVETNPVQPANQPGPQAITGQAYQGGVIETRPRQGVIETYRPQQTVRRRVIQGQPYQGGVVYNAVPNPPNDHGAVILEQPNQYQYYQPRGQYQQPYYPAPRYYQGQYYEPAPYQRPLFDGRIIRRWFPLYN